MESKSPQVALLRTMITNKGHSLLDVTIRRPVMLIFLRHFGCTFCREALAEISKKRESIEALGSKIVFVHMSDNETADRYFSRYNLENATHISDPSCSFYASFGLVKGNMTQLLGLQSWIRGFSSAVIKGHGAGKFIGDGFQMPGVFVISEGEVKESFIHKQASDRPDYVGLIQKCCVLEN